MDILFLLRRGHVEAPGKDLSAILGLSNPAATLVIDYWQARNALTRRKSATDGRYHAVEVTEQGRHLLAQLRQDVARHDANLTASLSQEELAQLYSSLKKIIGHKTTPSIVKIALA